MLSLQELRTRSLTSEGDSPCPLPKQKTMSNAAWNGLPNGQQPFASHARMSLRKGLEKRRQYRLASNVSFQQILRRSEQRVAGFGNPKPPSCSPAANPTSASGAEQTHHSISWSMLNAEPSLGRPYGARELPSAGKKPGHQKMSHRMIQPFSFPVFAPCRNARVATVW